MVGEGFLTLFDWAVELLGKGFSGSSFTVDFSLIDSAIYYIRMAAWFVPLQDILVIMSLLFILNNFQVVMRVINLLKGWL